MAEYSKSGLGALGVVANEELAQTVRNLRRSLKDIFPADGRATGWTREQAIKLLYAVGDAVGDIMDEEPAYERNDPPYVLIHPATQLLYELAAAIEDLKDGNVDECLKPGMQVTGSAYTARERSEILLFLEVVEIYRFANNKTSYPKAQEAVAGLFRKHKRTFRGDAITPKNLASWRKHPPGTRKASRKRASK